MSKRTGLVALVLLVLGVSQAAAVNNVVISQVYGGGGNAGRGILQ